jgi:hypothetical protein
MFDAPELDEAKKLLAAFRTSLGAQPPEALACLENGFAAGAQFYAFPKEHWSRIHSTSCLMGPQRGKMHFHGVYSVIKWHLFPPLLAFIGLTACLSKTRATTDQDGKIGPHIEGARVLQAKDRTHPVAVTLGNDDDGLVGAVRVCPAGSPDCSVTAQSLTWTRTGWVTLPRPLSQLGGATLRLVKRSAPNNAEAPQNSLLGRYLVSSDGGLQALPEETTPRDFTALSLLHPGRVL